MRIRLPDITHLQYLVLRILLDGETAGRDVREQLAAHGHRKSLAAFYMMMARMEGAKLVNGSYHKITVEGQDIQERRYTATDKGVKSVRAAREFYAKAG